MKNKFSYLITLIFLLVTLKPVSADALEPNEIMVLANGKVAKSIELARYYMKRRAIPEENLLILKTTDSESFARDDYLKDVAGPIKEFLHLHANRHLRCIVILYGLPLKISSSGKTEEEEKGIATLRLEEKALESKLAKAAEIDQKAVEDQLKKVKTKIQSLQLLSDRAASLDSELALVKKGEYEIGLWLLNPLFAGFQDRQTAIDKAEVMLTARLDGPDEQTVRRVIDDSITAEIKGLQGIAYFDARWQADKDASGSNYVQYDQAIHRAYTWLKDKADIDVQIEATEALYQQGDCPSAALYSGWYSLANYIDAFDWQPGSVGYHIASAECQTLKKPGSKVWCKKMLEDGITATIGPVGEPYLQAFPPPDLFFGKLLEERHCLVEAYFQSLPFLSWKMILVGDPLYRLNLKGTLTEADTTPRP
ncbi:MAG: TIGR03790 family protein [Desulfocapsaceae bacterium]|nr:TIGR03790 family protein [Desulfocapsaceae bacterium]